VSNCIGRMELLRSKEFTIHRVIVARMAAEAYVRLFWWFILPGPLFGIIVLMFSREPVIQAVGALGCVWPMTIPFRAYLITAKMARRLYSHPTTLVATDTSLLFIGEVNKFKADYTALRNAYIRHGMIVINTKRYAVLLVPVIAFGSEKETVPFMKVLSEHGVRVNRKSILEL
jgi:hypothetical protein